MSIRRRLKAPKEIGVCQRHHTQSYREGVKTDLARTTPRARPPNERWLERRFASLSTYNKWPISTDSPPSLIGESLVVYQDPLAFEQLSMSDALTIDHVAHWVPDLKRATQDLQRLGFSVTPYSQQFNRSPCGEMTIPAGASNRDCYSKSSALVRATLNLFFFRELAISIIK